jgi:tripartite-type tricarboxylate transporter receptor subunit TctC
MLSRAADVLIVVGLFGVFAARTPDAQAQSPTYPSKPIRLIVPFAPGGGTDIMARVVAQALAPSLRVPIVIDNRPGGGGIVGSETLVRATPDGYTLVFESGSYTTRAALYDLSFDPIKDITPISTAFISGFIVCLHPSVPVKSVKELIAYASGNPGKVNYGSSGVGGFTHLGTELFKSMAKIEMNHIPYKGTGPALTDLVGGQIHVVWGSLTSAVPHIRANRLRGIAVTAAKRWSAMPDLPAVSETVPGYEAAVWYGVWGPRNLPQPVISRWVQEISRLVAQPETKQFMSSEGVDPYLKTSHEFMQIVQADIAKWTKVVQQTNLKSPR